MLPSLSLGPPLLSLSASPALGPCGIPLIVLAVDVAPPEDEEVVGAAAPDELDDGLEELVAELEEFEPQAASATATSAASATAARRRADGLVAEFIAAP